MTDGRNNLCKHCKPPPPLPPPSSSKQSFTLFKKHCAAIPTTSKNVVNVFLTKYGCNFVKF